MASQLQPYRTKVPLLHRHLGQFRYFCRTVFQTGPVNSRKRTAKRLPVWPTASATFTGTDTDTPCCLLRIHFSVWFTQATHTGVFRYEDRCAPHNDVSVNDGPHIRRWSHNITASLCYICLQY